MDIRVITPVHITEKALLYANNRRTGLTQPELRQLIEEHRGIFLGSTDVDFLLVWDHHKGRPTVLLVARSSMCDTLVSIWGPHYYGIPNGYPSASQIALAKATALTS